MNGSVASTWSRVTPVGH